MWLLASQRVMDPLGWRTLQQRPNDILKQREIPKTRTEFWEAKIADNKIRDKKVLAELSLQGYRVAEIWECALKGKSALEINQIEYELRQFISYSDDTYCEIRGMQE